MNKKLVGGILGLAFAAVAALPDKGEEKEFARDTLGLPNAALDRDAYIEAMTGGRPTPPPSAGPK